MAGSAPLAKARVGFEGVSPILRVESLPKSIEYYVQVLGFHIDWQTPVVACVSRDRCAIFLCEQDQGNRGAWVWIGVENVAELFEEYTGKAARIRHPPTNYPWAREMQIEDPDGNVLRMGAEPLAGEPIGPWRDMRGGLWAPDSAGGWTRVD